MPPKLLRALLTVEYLIAIQVVFTFWSQVGGQYHLDLMYWPWKFGVSLMAALLITGITAALVSSEGKVTKRVLLLGSLLLATVAVAGCVTYYYHLNEPDDQDGEGDAQPTISRLLRPTKRGRKPGAPAVAAAGSFLRLFEGAAELGVRTAMRLPEPRPDISMIQPDT